MYQAVVWTNAAHEYTVWDDAATAILGWQESEVLGRHFRELFPRVHRQAIGRIWISFDYRVMCWDAQNLLGWPTAEVLGHRIEEYALEADGEAGRLECELGWAGVALMLASSGATVAVKTNVGPTRGGYLITLWRVIPEEGAGIDVAHVARWRGFTMLGAKGGAPVVLASDTLAQRDGDGETITGYRCRIRPVLSSELFLQLAETDREEVKTNTTHVAKKVLHGVPHVAQRATGPEDFIGAFSRGMSAAQISDHKLLVGQMIRLARVDRGKTQQQLAHKIGYRGDQAHSIIAGWETGDHTPKWDRQEQIAEALGIAEGASWFHRRQTSVPPAPKAWEW